MRKPLILVNSDVDVRPPSGARRVCVGEDYVRAVAESGGLPLVVPAALSPEQLRELAARCQGVLFVGGADYPPCWYGETPRPETRAMHPARATADRLLAEAALARPIAVLGICGGHQLLNLAHGGKLLQHLPHAEAHGGGTIHAVTIRGGRILRGLFGESRIEVNSSHHQAVAPDGLGRGLAAVAFADDGTLEALEGEDHRRFLLGVQWHPERCRNPAHRRKLFGAFVQAAQAVPA
jgi:putative glutamine amidotransferase